MKEKKYIVELTETQLRIIANCVEDCHRFMCGETDLCNMTSMLESHNEIKEKLEDLKPLVTPELSPNAFYKWSGCGCPNKHQRKFIAQTYTIYREILHFFAVEKGNTNTYTSETLTCEEGGSPIKINVKEE